MSDQFWNELRTAVSVVMSSGVRRADGDGFKVYVIGASNLVRIDITQPRKD